MWTCLRYFFQQIVCERYGYHIIYDRNNSSLQHPKDINYLQLGDTRHLALINMMHEGTTPFIAMMLAGHDNPEMTSHYYSNVAKLIECKTARQHRHMLESKEKYSISRPSTHMNTKEFTVIADGRCYSKNVLLGDFSDCAKVIGPGGEVGHCLSCTYHRSENHTFHASDDLYITRIQNECIILKNVVNKVRSGTGDPEDITKVLLRLKDEEYSYAQYLKETMEDK